MLSKKQIEDLVYQNTPIDTIMTTQELPDNGIEINGYVKNNYTTYQIYQNGQVIKK